MDIRLQQPDNQLPVDRVHALSMIISAFRGRRDVEVHLFRAGWDNAEAEAYNWASLIGPPLDESAGDDPMGSRTVLLESFTEAERNKLVDYIRTVYADRVSSVTSCPLSFPIPAGLTPLSAIQAGKGVGIIDFARIPRYNLPIALKGLYDLSRHEPIVQPGDADD